MAFKGKKKHKKHGKELKTKAYKYLDYYIFDTTNGELVLEFNNKRQHL
jgi:hypothetical protein